MKTIAITLAILAFSLSIGTAYVATAAPKATTTTTAPKAPTTVPKASPAPTPDDAQDDEEHAHKHKGECSGVLNLNTATADQLMLLPKVGEKTAERVLAYRAKHGGKFGAVKDLSHVKGFGKKTMKRLTPFLAVSGASTLTAE